MALHRTPFDSPPAPKAEDAVAGLASPPVRPAAASWFTRFHDRFERDCDGAVMLGLLMLFLSVVAFVAVVLLIEACGGDVVRHLPGRF